MLHHSPYTAMFRNDRVHGRGLGGKQRELSSPRIVKRQVATQLLPFSVELRISALFFAKIAGHIHAARGTPEQNRVHYYCGAEWGFL